MTDALMQTIPVPVWLVLVACLLGVGTSLLLRWQVSLLRQLYDGYRADRDALKQPCYDASCVMASPHAGACKHHWELPHDWQPPHPEKRSYASDAP